MRARQCQRVCFDRLSMSGVCVISPFLPLLSLSLSKAARSI